MPLPLVNLDDQRFEAVVDNSVKTAARLARDWTDHNLHDPGITIIDLLSWLAEQQQYALNRVRPESYRKFLALLGIEPASVRAASADVTFESIPGQSVFVPKGTPLAAGQVAFETAEELTALPQAIAEVHSVSAEGFRDHTERNNLEGVSYAAFGQAEAGSALHLGFTEPFSAGKAVSLSVYLSSGAGAGDIATDPPRPVVIPSALVVWEYYSTADAWKPLSLPAALQGTIEPILEIADPLCEDVRSRIKAALYASPLRPAPGSALESYLATRLSAAITACALRDLASDPQLLLLTGDGTLMFSRSGRISLAPPPDMKRIVLFGSDELFWLRARVTRAGFEEPPSIDTIVLHTVPVTQRVTLSEAIELSPRGVANETFDATTWLSRYGKALVQTTKGGGVWEDWTLRANLLESGPSDRHFTFASARIAFGDGVHGAIPLKGERALRWIAYSAKAGPRLQVGRSNGLPNQSFPIGDSNVLPGSLLLQVGEAAGWRDWTLVDTFARSGPMDRHFTLDLERGRVLFGDAVNGAIPPAAPEQTTAKNIRWISLALGGGEQGNVAAERINELGGALDGAAGLKSVRNRRKAFGGAAAETIAQAQARARRDLRSPSRAVTNGDYERLALATPGLAVARAKAVPGYDARTPDKAAPATVTVIVVPKSPGRKPEPSRGFLQTVCGHLDRVRLITTGLRVVGPAYVGISVFARIRPRADIRRDDATAAAIRALDAFLHPLTGGVERSGWPFGRPVYRSEVFEVLDNVAEIDCVDIVILRASGARFRIDAEGNVAIDPHALVFPEPHEIEIAPASGLCPPKGGCQ